MLEQNTLNSLVLDKTCRVLANMVVLLSHGINYVLTITITQAEHCYIGTCLLIMLQFYMVSNYYLHMYLILYLHSADYS